MKRMAKWTSQPWVQLCIVSALVAFGFDRFAPGPDDEMFFLGVLSLLAALNAIPPDPPAD